jgi:biotin carboxyl carrier protein
VADKDEKKPQKKIESLTKEQEAKFPEYRQKWLSIGLSTKPCDLEGSKKAAAKAYKAANLKAPEHHFVVKSPMAGAVAHVLVPALMKVLPD